MGRAGHRVDDSLRIQFADPLIQLVGDVHVAFRIHRYSARTIQQSLKPIGAVAGKTGL